METRFQTSFIPKKPLSAQGGGITGGIQTAPPRRGPMSSLFMTVAVIAFIISLVGVGGVYAWKQILVSSQENLKEQLAARQKQFNTDLIEQLKQANIQIDLAKQLLDNHMAVSQIFDIISRLTIANVRFLGLDLTAPLTSGDGVKIAMRGYGTSFTAIAFQSDVLSQLEQYGLRKVVKNPIMSDPALDQNGTVSFGFTATVDPASLGYRKSLTVSSSASDQPSSNEDASNATP